MVGKLLQRKYTNVNGPLSVKSNITGGAVDKIFRARVLGKYEVDYFRCRESGYVQTEKPYWLEEAYKSPINLCDTGILSRNIYFSKIIAAFLYSYFEPERRFLDYAGGYGILTRMMRDLGLDYYWDDPYAPNLVARGFEAGPAEKFAALSAIEVFEHLPEPALEIKRLLDRAGTIVFSTLLLPEPWPGPGDWWYYGREHGQHISFYTRRSLEMLAQANSAILATNGKDLHALLQPDCLPLEIEAGWFRAWLSRAEPDVRQAVAPGYHFEPASKETKHRFQLKHLLRSRAEPGIFCLNVKLIESQREQVGASSLARDYAEYLLGGGRVDGRRSSMRFPSRTEADNKMMLQRMAAQAEAPMNTPAVSHERATP
jgi:hypothetical protein